MVILAAVSGKHPEDEVVEVGYDLANTYGEDLVVLHVMEQEQFDDLRGRDRLSLPIMVPGAEEGRGLAYGSSERERTGYNLETAVEDAAGVAREVFETTLGSGRHRDVSAAGRVGDPPEEIVDEAAQEDARYVVVGGRKRSPVGKALFGSVSQSIILESDRPVVAVPRVPE
jgi:nucleotide-binding universal stress UspA family protein